MNNKILCADLFCGGGGTSTGMIAAFEKRGLDYELVGVNHWDKAIETNNLNHRGRYHRDGVERVRPRELVPGGRLHILWASPECTNHSRAKGGMAKDDQSRATAWDVLKWPQEILIDRIYIENVIEFTEWAPLLLEDLWYNGKWYKAGSPDPRKKGEIFRQYIRNLKAFGYKVDWQIMNAADFGAPTCRHRLIIQAVRGKQKIRWPYPTHSKEPSLFERPWRAAREIIDWDISGESIFDRKDPLAVNTLRRIYCGISKHGGQYAAHFGAALRAEVVRSCRYRRDNPPKKKPKKPLSEESIWRTHCPFPTLSALPVITPVKSSAEAFITVMRGVSPSQDSACIKDLNHPIMSISTNGHEGLCNAFVTRYNGGDNRNTSIRQPVPVVDCSNRYALIEPWIFATGQTSAGARSTKIDEPISTIVTKAEHCIVEPLIMANRFNNVPSPVSGPTPTIVTSGQLFKVDPMVISHKFSNRPAAVTDPLGVVTTVNAFSLAEPMCVSLRGTSQSHLGATAISVSRPLPTIAANGTHLAVVEPSIIDMSHPGECSAALVKSASDQLPTITTRNNIAIATPLFIPQQSGGTVKPVTETLPTIATSGAISIIDPQLVKYYGNDATTYSIDAPLDTVTTRDRFALASNRLIVDVMGNVMLLDILFRMLQPHELSLAMSFPADYKFAGTKSDAIKQIGNAVCPALAEALIAAALDDLAKVLQNAA